MLGSAPPHPQVRPTSVLPNSELVTQGTNGTRLREKAGLAGGTLRLQPHLLMEGLSQRRGRFCCIWGFSSHAYADRHREPVSQTVLRY